MIRVLVVMAAALALTANASAQQFVQLAGAPCATPPVLHCPEKDCLSDRVINPGQVVELKTRRTYFLDYPCHLKAGRAGHVHSEPARRRLMGELAAPLFPDAGFQR